MNKKTIALFSGGLDSIVAAKLILEQGIEVVGLHYTSCFASKKDKERGLQAERSAKELGIRLIVKDKGDEYFDIIKYPRYGYGKNMNPCIDCRIFMFQKTRAIMEEEGAGFLVTGEVVGQRPMSQKRNTMRMIEKRSGLDGLVLRPLSAHLLDPTVAEMEGIVDRTKLLSIAGRSRETQFSLAARFGLTEFASPAGGCLLTDPIFSAKLKNLLTSPTNVTPKDIEILTIGRYFRLNDDTTFILGRNEEENDRLVSLCTAPYTLFSPLGFKGPQGLLKGEITEEIVKIIAHILAHYGKQTGDRISLEEMNTSTVRHTVDKTEMDIERFRISLPAKGKEGKN